MIRRTARTGDPHREDTGQSYLVSMGDMLSGLLFLFIITLVLFTLRLKEIQDDVTIEKEILEQRNADLERQRAELERETQQLKEIIRQLTGGRAVRELLLLDLRDALAEEGTIVEVDLEHGILRLPEDVLFPSGSARLRPGGEIMLQRLGAAFDRVLPNYVWAPERAEDPYPRPTVEAIFVEGHTDNVPVRADSPFEDNWELSTARAITTYKSLLSYDPGLENFQNEGASPLFSVSGYADRRPVATNDTDAGRQLNRRIDIRFIMSPPKATPEALEAMERMLDDATTPE